MDERVYLVCYDIRDPKRWRRVFRLMKGYGEWVQLSVFQCRHGAKRHAEMLQLLAGIIRDDQDHILIVDIGAADRVRLRFTSLGKPFELMERGPVVV
jgi:CRISPR-associated protein Cas2